MRRRGLQVVTLRHTHRSMEITDEDREAIKTFVAGTAADKVRRCYIAGDVGSSCGLA
jgi:molybdopterin-guanine dinucleotide biosynthesis protein